MPRLWGKQLSAKEGKPIKKINSSVRHTQIWNSKLENEAEPPKCNENLLRSSSYIKKLIFAPIFSFSFCLFSKCVTRRFAFYFVAAERLRFMKERHETFTCWTLRIYVALIKKNIAKPSVEVDLSFHIATLLHCRFTDKLRTINTWRVSCWLSSSPSKLL